MEFNENKRYRGYLEIPDQTLTLNGCCQSYPLDRDYWNNQLLDRNFLINYPTVEHIKYPISEGLCLGDSSSPICRQSDSLSLKLCDNRTRGIWTIEEEGLIDNLSCQREFFKEQDRYWLANDFMGSCPPQGLPLLNTHIGQNLIDPCTQALNMNNNPEKNRQKNQCCPSIPNQDRKWSPRSRSDLLRQSLNRTEDINLINNISEIGNRRNVDSETDLIGINYLNNLDCYQNKICTNPLQGSSCDLFSMFFQDTNCIYPNYTPKFWDNLTKAWSGAQLVTNNCPCY